MTEPAADPISRIALESCADTRHHIRFRRDGAVQAWSLAELDRRAYGVAGRLSEAGIGAGDRVGIMASNRIEWVLLDLAMHKLGAVTAGFEQARFDPDRIISEYGLSALFAEQVTPRGRLWDVAAVYAWSEQEAVSLPPRPRCDPADICAIKFTSGSTGVPKGLEATVGSVNSSLTAVQVMFEHRDDDNLLVFLRLALLQQRYWIYSALAYGHDVTIADLTDAVPMAQATGPTVVMGVPGFYERLQTLLGPVAEPKERRIRIQGLLGGRIRYLWTGSAPASRSVLEFFNDCGVPLYEGYGQNETCIVAKNHPGAFRLGSVGRVLPDKTVRFDRDGILIVGSRYPVNIRYTWCGPGANERTFLPTGEVRTQDLGHVDEDGFLFIHGRVDDVVTLSTGRNVLVRPLEEIIARHRDVHDCVLFGTGQPFLTAVVSATAPDFNGDDLVRFLNVLNESVLPEQRIGALVLSMERFSVDNGLLSSQFKPKRAEIGRRFAEELAAAGEASAAAPLLLVRRA